MPWNPDRVLELRVDTANLPDLSGPIGLTHEGVAIELPPGGLGINRGFKVDTGPGSDIANAWAGFVALYGYEGAQPYFLAFLAAGEDTYFNAPFSDGRWYFCNVFGNGYDRSQGEDWHPENIDSHWGRRTYQEQAFSIQACYFHHLGGFARDGHAIYSNIHGDLEIWDCYFNELGGQAIQLVNREDTFKNGTWTVENRRIRGDLIDIRRVAITNAGHSDGRGSFPISIRDVGRTAKPFTVNIIDYWIACRWQELGSDNNRSRGGIMVEGHGEDYWGFGNVLIENGTTSLWSPDRQMMVVNNSEDVIVRNNAFWVYDGSRYIDYDRLDFDDFANVKTCGQILHEDNNGNCLVRLRDQIIGHVTDNFLIQNGVVIRKSKGAFG